LVSIRPERIKIVEDESTLPNQVPATVDRLVYAGPVLNVLVQIEDLNEITVAVPNEGHLTRYRHGDTVNLHMPAEAIRVLDRDRPEEPPAP
jgi:ABC-type Fe3+/spermidine/putrescine transport system ATPase subunit